MRQVRLDRPLGGSNGGASGLKSGFAGSGRKPACQAQCRVVESQNPPKKRVCGRRIVEFLPASLDFMRALTIVRVSQGIVVRKYAGLRGLSLVCPISAYPSLMIAAHWVTECSDTLLIAFFGS
jgi:hypothetical protein